MDRTAIFSCLALVAACGTAATVDPPPDEEEETTAAPTPQRAGRGRPGGHGGLGGLFGSGSSGSSSGAPACVMPAPPGTSACGDAMECDEDAGCAIYPGNYCAAASCQLQGCMRGQCRPEKIQGAMCVRDGECISRRCLSQVRNTGGVCAPEQGPYDFQFP